MSVIRASVVVPTCNQADRLRLVLCGLEGQTLPAGDFEVVVVDDGSTDHTVGVLAASGLTNLRVLRCPVNRGRSHARNLGLEEARGDLVVFLDGDALPAPDLLESYCRAHALTNGRGVLCGFQWSLPGVEYLQDPQDGRAAIDEAPSVLKDYLALHTCEVAITTSMVRSDFARVRSRAREGGYPFPESAARQRQARQLLAQVPDARLGWLAFVPHNGAASRALLAQAGGFDTGIPFSEGWELACRLGGERDARCVPVDAETFHLYHRHAFGDGPEAARREAGLRYGAIEHMVAKHADSRIRILHFWFASLWRDSLMPDELLVRDLVELDRQYRELPDGQWAERERVLRHHPSISPFLQTEVTYGTCA
ncbi:MAG: glycosyltransferase [Candidatus Latescibacterota bacterium]